MEIITTFKDVSRFSDDPEGFEKKLERVHATIDKLAINPEMELIDICITSEITVKKKDSNADSSIN